MGIASSHWNRIRARLSGRSRHEAPTFVRAAYQVPRQVVLITASHQDRRNVWPMDWHIPLSLEPRLYGIAVNRTSFGAELVRASGVFIVNFMSMDWQDAILYCGRTSGRQLDKFAALDLLTEPATSVDSPRLAESLGFLECRVEQTVEVGDHTLFIGLVTHSETRTTAPQLHHVDRSVRSAKFETEGA